MKTSLEWLSQYLPGESDPQRLADALTHGGLPVEVIERVGEDTVIDVEVTSNRGDCLSHVGIARELSALLDRPFNPVEPSAVESNTRADALVSIEIENLDLCPYYSARVIRGVRIGPSPQWMMRRLEAAGVRAINNVVDCSNFVMLELGQPLHAFDLDRIVGGKIVVRAPHSGETLMTLDGHNRRLTPDMLAIADADRPVALAGVMGGLESEVSGATCNLLIESARFDPLTVRRMGRALNLRSEASYRFERGIDPALAPVASLRCAQLILDTAGGELLAGLVSAGSADASPRPLSLRLSRLRQVLGIDIPPEQATAALRRLGLAPTLSGDRIECQVPSFRRDLNIEVDLIEEVARVIGYDRIPIEPRISIDVVPQQTELRAHDRISSHLVAAGYFEAVTFSFATDGLGELFAPQGVRLCQADPMVRKSDNRLRPSILPGLIEAIARNESVGVSGARLYEIGSTWWHAPDGTIDERRRLGLAADDDYRGVRGAVESLLGALDANRTVQISPADAPGFAPGASGRINWGDQAVGTIGVVAAAVLHRLGIRGSVVAAELDLPALITGTQHVPQLRPLPRFPTVRRDLSLVVSEQTPFDAIRAVIVEQKLELLEDLEYVTTYRGKPLDRGSKSVTVTLVFRSNEGTLTAETVDSAVAKVVEAAGSQLGATLRA